MRTTTGTTPAPAGSTYAEAAYYASTSAPPLKRLHPLYVLGKVATTATFYFWFWPYMLARAVTPPALKTYFYQLENLLDSYLGGVVRTVRGITYHLLKIADDQVDSTWTWLSQLHKENSTHFGLGREAYVQYVEDAASAVRRNGLSGLLKFFQGHTA